MATKGCDQLTSNHTYFFDNWFSGLKTAEEAMADGVDYCGMVKKIHTKFYLYILRNLMRDCPKVSYLVMKSIPRLSVNKTLLNIRYKSNYSNVLGLLLMRGMEVLNQIIPIYLIYLTFILIIFRPIVCTHLLGRYLMPVIQ